jgi:hypothetical protein
MIATLARLFMLAVFLLVPLAVAITLIVILRRNRRL